MKILMAPASGSIDGRTFSRGRAGQIVRTRRLPSNPLRAAALFPDPRPVLAQVASQWATLPAITQAAWTAAAASHPRQNRFHGSGAMSGFNLFVALNAAKVRANQPAALHPPTDWSVARVTVTVFTATNPSTVSLTISPAVPAGQTWFLGFSAPHSAGVQFPPHFSDFGGVGAGFSGAFTISTAYNNRYGSFRAGQAVFARVVPFGAGWVKGVPLILRAIAT